MRAHCNHRAYIGQPFRPDHPLEEFSDAEKAILDEYGAWFQAMSEAEVIPVTEAQKHFVEVCADLVEPETKFERVWVKYLCGKTPKNV